MHGQKNARCGMMLYIVIALIHEARPLIDQYRLRLLKGAHPYPIYQNDAITLAVSGVGKLAAAGAAGYLQGLNPSPQRAAWLNLGLSGHSHFEIGQGYIAHKILDKCSGRSYYPPKIIAFPGPSSELITVETPETCYVQPGGYDMEASGFFSTALRASTLELIQCYKVVSDNPEHPVHRMTKSAVSGLIADQMQELNTMISTLLFTLEDYRKIYMPPEEYNVLRQRWHFTETQKSQLLRLLQRWHALHNAKLPLPQKELERYSNAKTFLANLRQRLDPIHDLFARMG